MPRSIIDCVRLLSFRALVGSVHLPFPISGASFGAYLTATIQWSVGTGVGHVFQLNVIGVACLATYIQSNLDLICPLLVLARYVYVFSFGYANLHASCISQAWRRSRSASIVFWLSSRVGAQSISSSVTLKSPRMKSGLGILLSHRVASISFQNGRWVVLLLGA